MTKAMISAAVLAIVISGQAHAESAGINADLSLGSAIYVKNYQPANGNFSTTSTRQAKEQYETKTRKSAFGLSKRSKK